MPGVYLEPLPGRHAQAETVSPRRISAGGPQNALLNTEKHRDLIYDVGLHVGEDTDFYLRKGFRVVAFEANPTLASDCRKRFSRELASGQLTLIEGAIVDTHALPPGQDTVPFYVPDGSLLGSVSNDWTSASQGAPEACLPTHHVKTIDFIEALAAHGIPYYLKIDIEGSDLVCLKALAAFSQRPNYVSLESSRDSLDATRNEIELLASLGYDAFQAIEQSGLRRSQSPPVPAREGTCVAKEFGVASSGLFGAELPDCWKSRAQILSQYSRIWLGYRLLGDDGALYRLPTRAGSWARGVAKWMLERFIGASVPGWYDTHARYSGTDGKSSI
jgi:FkbM family methyltransferase